MVLSKIKNYARLVMFSHTLFSLPFALLTMIIAASGIPEAYIIFWGIIALIGARTGANAWNRVADAQIDAANPRTSDRHIPQKVVSIKEGMAIVIISYLIYVFAAYQINMLCFILSWIPLVLFTIYPYTKRFTNLCHIFLGVCCALAVYGAWIAVTGSLFHIAFYEQRFYFIIDIIPTILFLAVILWNTGFDIIYATQDIKHDQENNIHSIPATFGYKGALSIARFCHFLMMLLLLSLVILVPELGLLYLIGLFIASVIFIFEHRIIDTNNKFIMRVASYRLNQVISMTIFIFTSLDVIL